MALESDWNPPLGDTFDASISKLTGHESLDIGCALHAGSFVVDDDLVTKAEADRALIFFALSLLRKLQALGSAPAIEYDKYADAGLRLTEAKTN